ncbi:hypothetical protein LCGC14_0316580 [marine sediment metagenome]|uniref:Uncharacterized protein n=1 Tax=marine sediment metagenome TaxID=412755 RepID=A0A0F9W7T9_9ZZZZ
MSDTPMTDKTMREKITEHLRILVAREFAQYEGLIHKEQTMTETRGRVSGNIIGAIDAILAIPEIKEGQELREKRDRLVELANTQVKPALRADQLSSDDYRRGYRQGQYEMESAGFRRVKEKG